MNNDDVLDVAMAAYWHRDPADVSVNAITRMAGISKPSLYRECGSEDGLKLAVLDRYAEQVLSDMFVLLHGAKGLRETLDTLVGFASDGPTFRQPVGSGARTRQMLTGVSRSLPERSGQGP